MLSNATISSHVSLFSPIITLFESVRQIVLSCRPVHPNCAKQMREVGKKKDRGGSDAIAAETKIVGWSEEFQMLQEIVLFSVVLYRYKFMRHILDLYVQFAREPMSQKKMYRLVT